MKKLLVILLAVLTAVTFSSCEVVRDAYTSHLMSKEYDPHVKSYKADVVNQEETEKLAEQILAYLDSKDKESLKALFATQTAKDYDLDSQIDKVFEIYDGKSVSHNTRAGEPSSFHIDHGIYSYLAYNCTIEDIQTDNDKIFTIHIKNIIVDDETPDRVGLTKITLCKNDWTKIAPIGEYDSKTDYKYSY